MNYAVKNIYGKTRGDEVYVNVPGSKSITARAMLIAAAADGTSTLQGAQFSDDCRTFLDCLSALGIKRRLDGNTLQIEGCGGKPTITSATLNVGSAGTAARFLPAFLSFCDGRYKLDCSQQMKGRPVGALIAALKTMGAEFEFSEEENSYPFTVRGTLAARDTEVDVTESSQFLSALLISAVCASREFTVGVKGAHGRRYIDMTIAMMRSFGATVTESGARFTVSGAYSPRSYNIEPDASAAAYFYAANKILGTRLRVDGLQNSIQGDAEFISFLKDFDGGTADMSAFSDQTLTLAAIAPYLGKPTEIINVRHIRRQECDRIRAICVNLAAMGVRCDEREDGVTVYPSSPRPARVKTFGDHRVAMAFALTGLRADGIVIENAEVCSKTFAEYFTTMDKITEILTAP